MLGAVLASRGSCARGEGAAPPAPSSSGRHIGRSSELSGDLVPVHYLGLRRCFLGYDDLKLLSTRATGSYNVHERPRADSGTVWLVMLWRRPSALRSLCQLLVQTMLDADPTNE